MRYTKITGKAVGYILLGINNGDFVQEEDGNLTLRWSDTNNYYFKVSDGGTPHGGTPQWIHLKTFYSETVGDDRFKSVQEILSPPEILQPPRRDEFDERLDEFNERVKLENISEGEIELSIQEWARTTGGTLDELVGYLEKKFQRSMEEYMYIIQKCDGAKEVSL